MPSISVLRAPTFWTFGDEFSSGPMPGAEKGSRWIRPRTGDTRPTQLMPVLAHNNPRSRASASIWTIPSASARTFDSSPTSRTAGATMTTICSSPGPRSRSTTITRVRALGGPGSASSTAIISSRRLRRARSATRIPPSPSPTATVRTISVATTTRSRSPTRPRSGGPRAPATPWRATSLPAWHRPPCGVGRSRSPDTAAG